MWVETIFSRDDLKQLLQELLPTKIHLGDPTEDAWLALFDLGDVELVPQAGLRVTCKAKIRWEIAGVSVPVTLNSLRVLLRPLILKRDASEVLSFGIEIEHADLANVPEFIDARITERVNKELADKQNELSWDFMTTLSRIVSLPAAIEGVDSVDLKVGWGKLRIDADALVIVVSFNAHLLRDGATRVAPEGLVRSVPPPALAKRPPGVSPNLLLITSGVAFLSGAMIASSWARRHQY